MFRLEKTKKNIIIHRYKLFRKYRLYIIFSSRYRFLKKSKLKTFLTSIYIF